MMQPGMQAPQAGIGMGPQRPPQGPPGMQAPPAGGPQMPPPQPGMAGPQGADPMAMLAQLKEAPDQQLQQMVQSKHPLGSFALVMLNGRNQQRKAAQAQQQQQIANQPPVAQRVMQEAQQLGGVAALPTGQAIPQQFAGGGIVGRPVMHYQQAGLVKYDPIAESERAQYTAQTPEQLELDRSMGWRSLLGMSEVPTAENEYARLTDPRILVGGVARYRKAMQEAATQQALDDGYSNIEGYVPPSAVPPAAGSRAQVLEGARAGDGSGFLGQMNRAYSPTAPIGTAAPNQPPAPPIGRARPEAPGTGIASLVAGKPGTGFPEWKDPTIGAPAARMSDAEFSAYVQQKFKELEALYGPDVAMKYVKEMEKEREDIKAREPRARQEAWLTAGLKMMQGKSRHGLQNIGAGGEAGIAQYRADRQDADRQLAVLRDKMMQAEAAAQQRRDATIGMARQEGTLRNAQMGEDRKERIGVNESQQKHGVAGAMYALEVQKVQADMVRAQAAMKAAGAAAAANQDARMMNAVTMVEKRIDAAVKQRMAGHTFIQPGQEQALYAKYYTEEFNNALATNPFFREAVTGSARGATIDASGLGLGKKQ